MICRIGAALVALLVLASPANALRADPPPPFDYAPTWSPDGSAIAFVRSSGVPGEPQRLWVMRPDGSAARPLPAPVGTFSPDWSWVLAPSYVAEPPGGLVLRIVRPEGQEMQTLASAVVRGRIAWSPNAAWIAYGAAVDGSEEPALVVHHLASGRSGVVAPNARNPVWSPDGLRLAFENVPRRLSAEPDLGVVNLDGSNRRLYPPPGAATRWGYPDETADTVAWSPDGDTLAIPTDLGAPAIWLLRVDGSSRRRIRLVEPVRGIEWGSPTTIVGTNDAVYRIDVRTGRTLRLTRFGASADVSRDGRTVVFDGSAFCPGGIHLVETAGGRPHRVSPDCRILGTPGADVLTGTQHPDVLVGADGNDQLHAFDDWYYEGDVLEGGRGNDTLLGGGGTDVLRGGPGRDRFDGGGAPDVIHAADGFRDVVACGTHTGNDVERDVANVDRFDMVADDCEHVYYPGRYVRPAATSLLIRVWRGARPARVGNRVARPAHTWRLSCAPPRGTLPGARAVCDRLAHGGNVFAPISRSAVCQIRPAGFGYARVNGRFRGRRVTAVLRRRDGCEQALWRRLGIPEVL